MAQLGIKMIEMYCKMIEGEFIPLEAKIEGRITESIKDEVEKQVKMDFGIYEMYMQKEALNLQINEIDKKLRKYENREYQDGYRDSLIEREVRKRVNKLNEPLAKIEEAKERIIKQVKLTGVSTDIKDIFDRIGNEIASLKDTYGSLPPITVATVKALSSPRKAK